MPLFFDKFFFKNYFFAELSIVGKFLASQHAPPESPLYPRLALPIFVPDAENADFCRLGSEIGKNVKIGAKVTKGTKRNPHENHKLTGLDLKND